MPSPSDLSCKRCSVTRVNALIKAYNEAHQTEAKACLKKLRQISSLCGERGFANGNNLLTAGLSEKELRALCWNVSSFLKDPEVESILGVKFNRPC